MKKSQSFLETSPGGEKTLSDINVIYKDLKELVPYKNNPRKNDKAAPLVAASIKQFGFKVPIVIDKNNVIVCGHTRYKAAQALQIEKVPCIIAADLTDEQIKAYRLADNKVTEAATWDFKLLDSEMAAIKIDMQPFGFIENSVDEDKLDDFFENAEAGISGKKKKTITCPNCGEEIEI